MCHLSSSHSYLIASVHVQQETSLFLPLAPPSTQAAICLRFCFCITASRQNLTSCELNVNFRTVSSERLCQKSGKLSQILPRVLTYCFVCIPEQPQRLEKMCFFLKTQCPLFWEKGHFSAQKNTANTTLNSSMTGFPELLSYHLLVLLELYKAHESHILRLFCNNCRKISKTFT